LVAVDESVYSRGLCRIGARCAAVAALLAVIQASIEAYGVAVLHLPVPTSSAGWLELLHDHRVFAATALTTLQIPMFALTVPVLIALDRVLDGTRSAIVRVACVVGCVGIAVFLSTHPAAGLLDLSDRYAASADPGVRSQLASSADSLFALYQGTGLSTGVGVTLIAVAALSAVMGRHAAFGHRFAIVGGSSAVTGVGYFVAVPFEWRIYILEVSGALFIVWLAMVGWRLWRLSRVVSATDAR
jgi:hypothetical protein